MKREKKQLNPEKSLRRWNRTCALLCAGAVVQSLGAVAVALVSRRLLDSAMGGGAVVRWGVLLAVLAVGAPVLGGVLGRISGRAEDEASAQMRRETLELLRGRLLEPLKGYHSGQLYSRVTADIGVVCQWKISVLPGIVAQSVRLCAAAAALCWLSPVLAVWAAVFAVAVGCGSVVYRRVLRPRYQAARQAQEQLTVSLQEELSHGEFIRSAGAEEQMRRRLESSQNQWLMRRKALRDVSILGGSGFSAMTQIVFASVMVWGGVSIRSGRMTYGDLTAMLQLIAMFQGPVSGFGGLQSRLAERSAARERLSELWKLPEEEIGIPLPKGAEVRSVVFENVTFRYEGESAAVVERFSCRLPIDRWICLRGISGSGKSTLYRLILGLYRPQEGRVYLETNRGNFDCCAATRPFFGFVPQTSVLLAGTVRENLRLVRPDAGEERMLQALEEAQCGFLFEEGGLGLDTRLSEDGGLSAGQRQRLSVAMALLSGGQMLLLDEITSALDAQTEHQLLKALTKSHKAAIFATHHSALPEMLGAEILDLDKNS